eukprot:XP_001697693.1 predicted protein [Chlamydomonas reinhardtii]
MIKGRGPVHAGTATFGHRGEPRTALDDSTSTSASPLRLRPRSPAAPLRCNRRMP